MDISQKFNIMHPYFFNYKLQATCQWCTQCFCHFSHKYKWTFSPTNKNNSLTITTLHHTQKKNRMFCIICPIYENTGSHLPQQVQKKMLLDWNQRPEGTMPQSQQSMEENKLWDLTWCTPTCHVCARWTPTYYLSMSGTDNDLKKYFQSVLTPLNYLLRSKHEFIQTISRRYWSVLKGTKRCFSSSHVRRPLPSDSNRAEVRSAAETFITDRRPPWRWAPSCSLTTALTTEPPRPQWIITTSRSQMLALPNVSAQ